MNRIEILNLIRNSKTKKEVKVKLGLFENGLGTKKLIKICDDLGVVFENEFSSNIKKNNNCCECDSLILLSKKFCNSSCSAKYNNSGRKLSNSTKSKISKTFKEKYKEGYVNPNKNSAYEGRSKKTSSNYDAVEKNYKYNCKYCGEGYKLNVCPSKARKSCSRECMTKLIFKNRTYRNGSRKTIYYYNKFIDETIILESSWELRVAKLLDLKGIHWIRPGSLDWVDEDSNVRQYYPDFYLKDYKLYLDPKNEYCMKLGKVKMLYIEKRYNIEYGDVNKIIEVINKK
jgi:hypothetical protein